MVYNSVALLLVTATFVVSTAKRAQCKLCCIDPAKPTAPISLGGGRSNRRINMWVMVDYAYGH